MCNFLGLELPYLLGNTFVNLHLLLLVNHALFVDVQLLESIRFAIIHTDEDSLEPNIVHHIPRIPGLPAFLAFVLLRFGIDLQELIHLHVALRCAL